MTQIFRYMIYEDIQDISKIYELRVLQTYISLFTKFVFLGSLYFTLYPK